jgi:tetratricopeptide (TPR) repeat protein/serine/threonine protein kinase
MAAKPVSLDSIFCAAVEIASEVDRAAYIAAACGDNRALRGEVEKLVQGHFRAGSFLERPAEGLRGTRPFTPAPADAATLPDEGPGAILGPYKLVQQIGEGGMGTVWMAQQTEPVRRLVALKVIKAGMDSRQVLARFEAERQALALMDHPHIARVLDAGTTPEGRPYFVMELVKGVPLTKYCDEHRLTPKQRLELFVPVCQAIQHAHQKGVIHRDVKPSNVLVAQYDGRPVPKVIDFGIAKATGPQLTEHTLVTGFGTVVGTLEYMSPEQAELNQLDIDTRSDIYSLGVLLYELLTGSTPLEKKRLKEAALVEVLRLIREEDPPRPSTRLSTTDELPSVAANRGLEPKKLSGLVRGELDWIVMKALDKDRNRRYESADAFALDVQRYLADEPVLACPPSVSYRLRKFARRNKGGLAAAGLALAFLASLAGMAAWAAKDRADRAREAALQQAAQRAALETDIARDLDEARAFCREGRRREASALVDHAQALVARGGAGEDLGGRVAQARADVDMVARLEAIRLEHYYASAEAEGHYRDAFRDYGLDVTALDAGAAAARIRASAIKDQLLAALDDWRVAEFGHRDPRLLAVLQRADDDPWRGRFRDAKDRKALEELARDPEALAQPPATVLLLASALFPNRPLLIEVLRAAQQRHPDDYWLNFDLAQNLDWSEPARHTEALGYYRAALAIRPDRGLHVHIGQDLRQQGDLAGAAAEYRQAIALQPQLAVAHAGLGVVLDEQGDFAGAVAEYRKAIALKPNEAVFHYTLGNCLRHQGDLAGAAAAYRQAIALQPGYAEAHNNLGSVLSAQGDLPGAVAEFRKALTLKPKELDYHTNLGNTLDAQGDPAGALAEFRECVTLRPDSAITHYNLGNYLGKQGKLDEAVACYRKAIDLDPKNSFAHNNLGIALAQQGKGDEAAACYKMAIALDPKNAAAHNNLGNCLGKQGKLDEAIACYRKAIEVDPKYAGAHNNLGLALVRQGKLDEAIACYRKAVEVDPKNATGHFNLGLEFVRQGKWDEAVAAYRRAIELDPKVAEAHCNLGLALKQQGKVDQAIAEYRKAIELDPKDAKAHNNLGLALAQQGKSDEAVTAYRRAIELDPKDAVAHANLGITLLTRGKTDEAMAVCRRAIELDPKDAKAHTYLGLALDTKGRPDEAVDEYRRAIELDPKYALAHTCLALALSAKGQWDEAAAKYRRVIELEPKNAPARVSLGNALYAKGRPDEAVAEYRRAIEVDPKYAMAHNNLGVALDKQGKLDEAIACYRKAIDLDPKNAPAHINVGNYLVKQGKLEEAIAEYRRAVELDPKEVNPWAGRGHAYSNLGQYDKALADYQTAVKLAPTHAGVHNALAWLLATCPDAKLRDPDRAVELARKAVELAPKEGNYWNTLGVAHYRAGDWKAAVAALEKSRELRNGGDAIDWLFLAMAHRKLGNEGESHRAYEQALRWLEQNRETLSKDSAQAEELRRFRSEAEEVLELKKQ